MAAAIGKLTIIIGAGLVGTAICKDGRLSDVTSFFSGALKIVTKHLQQDKDNTGSTSRPHNDFLLAQVNNLRQELQLLVPSRSVTIVTGTRSGSGTYNVTAIVVVGVVGYGYIWWKGWKLSDMMFVTRRGFTNACSTLAKQLDNVSSSISTAKRHLSSRLDHVDCNLDESMELTTSTKEEVSKLHGTLTGFHGEVGSVQQAVHNLETKLGRIEGYQELTNRGVYHLCQFVQKLEKNGNREYKQASLASSSRPALELPEITQATRAGSIPSPGSEPTSPYSNETPKVLRPPRTVSISSIKEIQGISRSMKAGSPRPSVEMAETSEAPSQTISSQEPGSSSSSSSGSGWRLPGIFLARSRSSAS